MFTTKGRAFWAKAIGKAVYNEIIDVRDVFQDIDVHDYLIKPLNIAEPKNIFTKRTSLTLTITNRLSVSYSFRKRFFIEEN